ncbi:hypothetical protein MLD38_029271 [Melastoma candidum]|uniref:Uncharacterized protein n=1 Tax=Melastoma candidum TaxID=119954 RepID=A0ACB9N3L1_9MYRT|nr:hypothetical protein MLD38_029271 [Melastoma candidum]
MSSSYRVLALALHVIFVLVTCTYVSEATFFPPACPPPPPPPQNKTATFYLQFVIANGTNNAVANGIPVAGIQGTNFGLQQFGTVYVFDVNITTTTSPTSTLLGQSYGTLEVTGLKGFIYLVTSTYVFSSGEFAGSTLTTQGVFDMSQQVSYFAVVGGTNALTYATGYVAYQIVVNAPPYFVIQVTANFKLAA